jgi:hypothetical protein
VRENSGKSGKFQLGWPGFNKSAWRPRYLTAKNWFTPDKQDRIFNREHGKSVEFICEYRSRNIFVKFS